MTDTTPTDRAAPPPQRPRRFRTPRTVIALILREMATTYGRSPGGYVWAVLEPVGAIAVLSIAFSFMIRSPALGTSFPLFYATAYLPFMVYNDLAAKIMVAIRFSRPLLAYPGVTYLDAILGRLLLNLLTHIMVFYVVMTGIDVLFETRAMLDFPAILLAMAMAALLGLGIGTLNCFLSSMVPVWINVWTILSRPMFILSGIFYLYDNLPATARDILWYNPLIHVTAQMRAGFYATYDPVFVSPIYVFTIALVALAFGLVLLNRYHRDILNDT